VPWVNDRGVRATHNNRMVFPGCVTFPCDLNHSLSGGTKGTSDCAFGSNEFLTEAYMLVEPVLIVSQEKSDRDVLANSASNHGLRPVFCQTLAAAKAFLDREQSALVFCADELPDGHFAQLFGEQRDHGDLRVIVVSRRDDWNSYLDAMSAGAFDYVIFPPSAGEIDRSLWIALGETKRSANSFIEAAA
jgi:DNA-binding NtrC family response regulator